MSNSNSNDLDTLHFVLDLCKFEPIRKKDIIKHYKSITELITSFNLPKFAPFQFTIEEKKEIVQITNHKRRAALDTEESFNIYGPDISLQEVIEYQFTADEEEHLNQKRKKMYEANKEKIDKIYEHEFNKMKKIPQYGNYFPLFVNSSSTVLHTIAKLVKQFPFMSKNFQTGFLEISDEILGIVAKWGSVRINLTSGCLIFGVLSAYSLGRNFSRYYQEKDRGTFTFHDFLSCSANEIAIIGASCGTSSMAGKVGGLIGLWCPLIGPLIGGMIGSLIGLIISNNLLGSAFDNIQKKLVLKKLKPDFDKSLYLEALRKEGIDEYTKVADIKSLQKHFRNINLPDEDMTDQIQINERFNRFIEKEMHFRIIEGYRKANKTWMV